MEVLDLFERHLRFVGKDNELLRPSRPLGVEGLLRVGEDRTGVLSVANTHESWTPPMRAIRPAEPHEIDPETEKYMEAKMPQFSLRMIGRVERIADPEEVEFEASPHVYGMDALDRTGPLHRPARGIDWLKETHASRVAEQQRCSRFMRDDMKWERHFCRELKEHVQGPLWRYNPDALEDGHDDH